MAAWKANPEVRYREGYEEGALALFRQIEHILPTVTAQLAVAWLEQKLEPWRLEAQRVAASGGTPVPVLPPPLKII